MATPGIRGRLGQIKYAYYTAAVVTDYVITRDEFTGQLTLTGTVSHPNAYLLGQSPLTFVHVMNGRPVRWPVTQWTLAGTRCAAQLQMLQP